MEQKHNFVKSDLKINSFADLEPYYNDLLERPLETTTQVNKWLADSSELEGFVDENFAWRYIKTTCNTADKEAEKAFNTFVAEIEPKIAIVSDKLNKRFLQEDVQIHIDKAKLFTMVRSAKMAAKLFREENVPIEAELQQAEQEFGAICSQMTINIEGKDMTMQQAGNYMKTAPRNERQRVYELMGNRRLQDKDRINTLLDKLLAMRATIAKNAGFDNYLDFRFCQLGRFDYTVADCEAFHNAIEKIVVPIVEEINLRRKKLMNVDTLRPYDLTVDLPLGTHLKPFKNTDELVLKTARCFRDLDSELGIYMSTMRKLGRLDLDSRVGKAPGGYNYPLYDSNTSFIFMNAAGNMHDMVTLMHEGGHAVHAFLCANQPLVELKNTPAEVAELASMSMELLSMAHWDHFFEDEKQLKIAKLNQLEDVISVLPWIAAIDKFQHFLYRNPGHTAQQREQAWLDIEKRFGCRVVDYSGYEDFLANKWQRQLHIFEIPLYYIEYGFAQLGAISIWKRFTENPQQAIADYKKALQLGYSRSIPEIYEAAGIKFCFTEEYIAELMEFVKGEMAKLEE